MKTFVIAMPNEAETVVRHLADRRAETLFGREVVRGTLGGEPTAVVTCGVGKANAAAGTQLALSLGADAVLNVGVAGGLDPRMAVGEIYGVDRAVQYDFDLSEINGTPKGTLNEYAEPHLRLATPPRPFPLRTLATGDRFTDAEDDFDLVIGRLQSALRDMEGAAIAHVCDRAGVPCHAWKALSDVRGGGSMTGQYRERAAFALERLAEAVPALFAAV
ncbi:MAG: 5'-methylthioadenosine/S-adenosylhomocysteine nucleosidase [Kiritimatiellae bacterium]|nr:5'-methylthioadenosine/S-adenosylhomocysteine nucleosidase [Kiritimatiellia bacterium]